MVLRYCFLFYCMVGMETVRGRSCSWFVGGRACWSGAAKSEAKVSPFSHWNGGFFLLSFCRFVILFGRW